MKCNRCGKKIDELEIFCNECKIDLTKTSSRSDVKELEQLIENQKRLTDLENTKELVNLEVLVKEEIEKEEIKGIEKTQVFEAIKENEENKQEEIKSEKKEEKQTKKKKKKKKLIIIISVISVVLIIALILLFIFLNKDKEEEKEVVIDYEKVIKTYGDSITDVVKDYMSNNDDIPTWQYVIEKLDYDRYEVECNNHNIYGDGSIYLSECKVNNKKTKYTYGIEKEEIKEGKKISIYKQEYDGYKVYSNVSSNSSILVGTITCESESCYYINAFDKYVLIKEENQYYLYDYTNDSINFGPFNLNNEYDLLISNNELYGILYKEENIQNIYNVKTGKILKNIKGQILYGDMSIDPSIMYKYNYAIFNNNGKKEFVNLKSGNVSYSISENILSFIEDTNKKIVYITTCTNDSSKFKIYNSNGKLLFDGKEYSKFIVGSKNLLVATQTNFKVYDNNLKLKTNSKEYDKVLELYEDYAVVVQDNNLLILNNEDKELTKFEDVWYEGNNIFHDTLSGISNKKNKNGLYIIIENKKIPSGTKGRFVEYYYIPSTNESGLTELSSI